MTPIEWVAVLSFVTGVIATVMFTRRGKRIPSKPMWTITKVDNTTNEPRYLYQTEINGIVPSKSFTSCIELAFMFDTKEDAITVIKMIRNRDEELYVSHI